MTMDPEHRTVREVKAGRLARATAAAGVLTLAVQVGLHLWLLESPLVEVSLLAVGVWIVVLTALHEGVHAVGYRLGGATWSQIDFGVEWRKMYAWAACRAGLTVEDYAVALLLPLPVTGLLPWALGLALGQPELALGGAVLTAGSVGDLILWNETRDIPPGTRVYDSGNRIGFELPVGPDGS